MPSTWNVPLDFPLLNSSTASAILWHTVVAPNISFQITHLNLNLPALHLTASEISVSPLRCCQRHHLVFHHGACPMARWILRMSCQSVQTRLTIGRQLLSLQALLTIILKLKRQSTYTRLPSPLIWTQWNALHLRTSSYTHKHPTSLFLPRLIYRIRQPQRPTFHRLTLPKSYANVGRTV